MTGSQASVINPSQVRCRPMAMADAPRVAELSADLGYPTASDQMARRFADLLSRRDNGMYVAERNMIVAGWGHVYGVRLLETDGYAEIGGIVVGMNHRRCGVGKALLRCAEGWAHAHEYSEVRLRSGTHRTQAHLFYLGCGYIQSKASFMFRRSVVDLASADS